MLLVAFKLSQLGVIRRAPGIYIWKKKPFDTDTALYWTQPNYSYITISFAQVSATQRFWYHLCPYDRTHKYSSTVISLLCLTAMLTIQATAAPYEGSVNRKPGGDRWPFQQRDLARTVLSFLCFKTLKCLWCCHCVVQLWYFNTNCFESTLHPWFLTWGWSVWISVFSFSWMSHMVHTVASLQDSIHHQRSDWLCLHRFPPDALVSSRKHAGQVSWTLDTLLFVMLNRWEAPSGDFSSFPEPKSNNHTPFKQRLARCMGTWKEAGFELLLEAIFLQSSHTYSITFCSVEQGETVRVDVNI